MLPQHRVTTYNLSMSKNYRNIPEKVPAASREKFLTIAIAIAIGIFAALMAIDYATYYLRHSGNLAPFETIAQPYPAPDLVFEDAEGNLLSVSDFQGKPLILNFWATWCAPCREEMPFFDQLAAEMGDEVAMVTVSQDLGGMSSIRPFFEELGLQHLTMYADPNNIAMRVFRLRGLPTTFLINSRGELVGRAEGVIKWDLSETRDLLAKISD